MTDNCTYIVLLNWNGWQDTIACLESLFRTVDARFRVVVCDNQSSDDSLAKIAAWARGTLLAEVPDNLRLAAFVGHTPRPVGHLAITASDIDAGRVVDNGEPLILIDNEGNLGFAAGNNVGLRYALDRPDMTHAWILNNDTVVDPHCLSSMLARLSQENDTAVCGSIIHFFDNPETIQAIGGNRFNERTGVAFQSEGRFRSERELDDCDEIEEKLDYVSGCSMLVPRSLLQSVGLLNEEYFLYYEEIDWFTRAARSCFRCCIAADAHVYHREGGSIGSPSWRQSRPSLVADFHIFRSKHLFMRKYHPESMLWCYLSSYLEVGKRILRGQFQNARVVLSVLLGATSLRL